MNKERIRKISNGLSAASIGLLLIALLIGFSFIRIGIQNLVAIDNVDIGTETFSQTATKTEAELVVSNTQISQVRYYVDGEEMNVDVQVYTDAYQVGNKLDLYYNNDDPSIVRVPDLFKTYYDKMGKMMLKIGIGIVGVCAVLGLICWLISRSLRKKLTVNKEI